MKQIISLFVIFALMISCAFAQKNAFTNNSGSAILVGANNKVKYISKIQTRNNIPPILAPYVAGLLFANSTIGSDTNSVKTAVTVWMKKYLELKSKILAITDSNKQNTCMRYLDQGDFVSVEKTLSISTNYKALKTTFPETYQTNGSQSPIIIGDFGTVTYIVDELVTFDLPEGLTVNLMRDLKLSKDSIRQKNQEVREWFEKYRSVERELARSPGKVNQNAYRLFKQNNFDGALKELDKAGGNDQATASSHLLKAKILLLQLNYKAYDSTVVLINKYFGILIGL